MGQAPVLRCICGFSQLLAWPFCLLKEADEIPPGFLQPEHGIPGPAEERSIAVQQLIAEGLKGSRSRTVWGKHPGGTDEPPAQHDGAHALIPFRKALDILPGAQVAIKAEGVFAVFQSICKGIHIHRAVIEGIPDPGMDDQQLYGILVVNFQQPGKFRRLCHTQPGFQGDGQGRIRKNTIQKPLQSIRVPEQPGAFSFGKHRAGGAAQVQIDLPVASVSALLRRPEKILYGFRQQLRHCLKVHSVRHG